MILALVAQLAHAGSIGLYTDMSAGPQLTDYQIDVHVPFQVHLSTGVFRGNGRGVEAHVKQTATARRAQRPEGATDDGAVHKA